MPHTLETQPQTTAGEASVSPLAGKPAPKEMLIDVSRMEKEYCEHKPDVRDRNQLVSFGTSGHRGSPLHGTFNEAHILAITQAICEYRRGASHRRPSLHGEGYSRASLRRHSARLSKCWRRMALRRSFRRMTV